MTKNPTYEDAIAYLRSGMVSSGTVTRDLPRDSWRMEAIIPWEYMAEWLDKGDGFVMRAAGKYMGLEVFVRTRNPGAPRELIEALSQYDGIDWKEKFTALWDESCASSKREIELLKRIQMLEMCLREAAEPSAVVSAPGASRGLAVACQGDWADDHEGVT